MIKTIYFQEYRMKLAISKILVSEQFPCSLHNLISNFSTRHAFRTRVQLLPYSFPAMHRLELLHRSSK
jgi:hypothetical protein